MGGLHAGGNTFVTWLRKQCPQVDKKAAIALSTNMDRMKRSAGDVAKLHSPFQVMVNSLEAITKVFDAEDISKIPKEEQTLISDVLEWLAKVRSCAPKGIALR